MKTKLTTILLIAGFLCAQTQTWTWSEDSLSNTRMGISATVLDDSIFYSSGRIDDYSIFSNVIDIYDVGEDEWDTYESQSSGRWQTKAVSANGMVFFAGGNNYHVSNWESFADIDVYNKANDEWTVEYLSIPRSHMGTVANGNKVFFAGGAKYESSIYYDTIDIYNTETDEWSIDNLSLPRAFMGSASAGSKVFFAGGATGSNQVTDVVDIYDINNDEWTVEYLSEPRAFTAAVAYEGKVYFAGGVIPNSTTSSVVIDIYNVEGEYWEDTITLSDPRIVKALNVKDALIFTGECDYINLNTGGWVGSNGTVEIYYPETGVWDPSVPPLEPARIFYAYTSYDNKAYYAGGWLIWTNQGAVNTVNILEYPTNRITEDKLSEFLVQVLPNPFTAKVQVDYSLQHPGKVNIVFYNNIGKQVKVLLDKYQQRGEQQIIFNTKKLNPGVYFCVLKTSEGIQTTKMIKL